MFVLPVLLCTPVSLSRITFTPADSLGLAVALAWMFYGSNNGFILEALLYRSASFVSTIASAASKPILTAT